MTLLTRRQFVASATAALLPGLATAQKTGAAMRLRCRFADQDFSFLLQDNATTRDLVSLLPLVLSIADFSSNEKLAQLPRRLDESGRQPIADEAPGDLCYFRGWGNLAFFHSGYTYRDDLIRLGRIEGGVAPLLVKGEYPLQLDLLT
ncbi:cyclophilin-like fold protein [Cypionkella sp.]|uniref:cyclophilin-like fold protein n=1 Tax=Cypionkella sp. TaxID=2811411 RepID=UPI002AB9EA7A|nr:cyclophilin-like fold protein [Cypionkella sp.]MDZ4393404.1 cyclophilin-like fold protein [Cypionkella sp.]